MIDLLEELLRWIFRIEVHPDFTFWEILATDYIQYDNLLTIFILSIGPPLVYLLFREWMLAGFQFLNNILYEIYSIQTLLAITPQLGLQLSLWFISICVCYVVGAIYIYRKYKK
ncbi:hypothetical protein [Gracilibacillus boraciitolerans]|uniref:hypothetical protein n=1 Tax=Gracilibacillus boraciitolerans TaxID=307521 RepID=UPI0005509DAF|nr:hypothetical protein [Gracilibacillus boraciitolerans]